MWACAGMILCYRATQWLAASHSPHALLLGLAGGLLAVAIYRYGFSLIARRNIARIARRPDRTCLFAFQGWKSYVLVAFMISLGIAMRHSGIPLHYLSVVYAGIGGALILSSLMYYHRIWTKGPPPTPA